MRIVVLPVLAAFVVGLACDAVAADRAPVFKAPPPAVAPLPEWGGAYFGIQAGAGWGRARQTDDAPFDTGWYDLDGGLVGATWGYNWHLGRFVVGFESDIAKSWIRGATDAATVPLGPCGGNPSECRAELQWFGTSRVRAGWTVGRLLPYLTAGLAWGTIKAGEGNLPIVIAVGSGTKTRYGWTLGGGLEAMIRPHWSFKVEYLYIDLRNGRVFVDDFGGGIFAGENVAFRAHIVRAGLNYHLGPGKAILPIFASTGTEDLTWRGFYLGASFGGGFGDAEQSDPSIGFSTGAYNVSGAIVGAGAGHNWQLSRTVVGVEADISYSSIKGETHALIPGNFCFGNPQVCGVELRWLGTARLRAGVPWNGVLAYLTGGLAVGGLHGFEGNTPLIDGAGAGTKTRVGWTLGAGIEAKINSRWSSKFEYLYVDLGERHLFDNMIAGGGTQANDVSFRTHIIRGGLNYRLQRDEPVQVKN